MENTQQPNIFEIWENKISPVAGRAVKFWYIPLIITALVFAFTYMGEKKKKPVFAAKITCMLEDDILGESQSAGPGSQLLMALSGQKTQSNKAVIVDLSLSNKLVEQTLIRTVVIDSQKYVLANYFIEHCGYRDQWKEAGNKEMISFSFPENYAVGADRNHDFWLRQFSNSIKLTLKSQVMESGLIVMNFSASDENFTKSFLDNHLRTISEFYIEKKTERSLNLIQFAQRKKDSLQAALTGKTYGLASMQDQGFGAVMRRAKVPEMQVTRDIGIITQQYNESVLALSSASIDLERQKPFITVVDDIRLPLESTWPKPLNKAIIFSVFALLLSFAAVAGVLLGTDYLADQKKAFEANN